ncbi:hypothetical protein ET989_06100 [Propioniciclava sinopodophylli]|uniref:Uncharacterized protein n=1 Tax=Propioniciclava sinopodophylli TaxID=1837344 RepID=A0A4Q9KGU1_9ACTN|nr:hypothetical protein ET989_06100 [Propioniciclava sinopodophylli]
MNRSTCTVPSSLCRRVRTLVQSTSETDTQGAVPTRHRFIARARLMAALKTPAQVALEYQQNRSNAA